MDVWSQWILYGVTLLAVKGDSDLYIRDCFDKQRTVIEGTNVTLICSEYTNRVEWYLYYPNSWQAYSIGYCYRKECHLYNGVNIPVQISILNTPVSGNYESQLDIKVITRQQAGVYRCYNTQSGETATCGLRVTAPAIIIGENCSVWVSKWQIYGTCAVERMYASDNVYNCKWRKNNNEIQGGFQDPMTDYILDSRTYRRAVCSFSQKMPVVQGSYTYSMDVDPGSQKRFFKTINIVPPGEPEHDCPETVFEGYDASCKCTSSNTGSPPAEFVWDGEATDTLFLQDIRPENTALNYSCRLIWGPKGSINRTIVYTLRIAQNENEKNTASSDNNKGGIIGGVVAAVFIIAIIGIVIALYIVKWRREKTGRGNIDLKFWHCPCKFFHRKKPLPTPYAVVHKPKPQTPIKRQAASSGDLYTVAMTTTSSDLNGEYVTVCETNGHTEFELNREGNYQVVQQNTESLTTVKPAKQSKPVIPGKQNVSYTSGYMNVTEVPTDSGLGVYHVVPWAVTPTGTEPDFLDNHEVGISEEEYHALQFEGDRTEQEDHDSNYHHLQHE